MKTEMLQANLGPGNYEAYSCTPSILAKTTFFYVQGVGHFHCNKDYYTRREGYKSFLLIYTMNGKGYANYRGKQYELEKGKALLMDCYDYQEYFTDREELWDIKWLHFYGGTSEEYFNIIYEKHGPVINIGDDSSTASFIDSIMELAKEQDVQFEIKASNLIVQILTSLMLVASEKNGASHEESRDRMVQAALEFVEKNYSANIKLGDMAQAACCSMYHFIRVFKRVTGYSPYEFLIKYRINRAKDLLRTTNVTVEAIADSIGFDSTSSFIKTFREIEGLTPLKYRRFWNG